MLLEQVWVHDGESRVKAVLGKAGVKLAGFARFQLGEGIDKPQGPGLRRRGGRDGAECNATPREELRQSGESKERGARPLRRRSPPRSPASISPNRSTLPRSMPIWSAIDRYAVVVFRDQRLTDAQLRDFAATGSARWRSAAPPRARRRRLAIPQIGDISNLDEDNQRPRLRRPAPARQPRQPAVAHRRIVHAGAGRARHAARGRAAAAIAVRQRRDRVRRHARRLRRAAGRTKAGDRRAGRRARHLLVARPDRLHRIPGRRARAVPAVAAAAGAPASGLEAQDAVPVRARLAHRRLAGRRWPPAAAGPDRARDAARSSSTATPGGSAIW